MEPIGASLVIEPVSGVNVLTLSKEGKVIGRDGHPLSNGYLDDGWVDGLIPFPENCLSVVPMPLDEIRLYVTARLEEDQKLIDEMLETPIIKEKLAEVGIDGEPAAIKVMRIGKTNIETWLRNDSHVKMATNFLPPTASLLTAVYSPEKIYAEA